MDKISWIACDYGDHCKMGSQCYRNLIPDEYILHTVPDENNEPKPARLSLKYTCIQNGRYLMFTPIDGRPCREIIPILQEGDETNG